MPKIEVHPLTPDRWDDVVELFGPRGACAGCWCMYWRMPASEWNARRAGGGAANRDALRRVVARGAPGLVAYVDGVPAGWCALAPRADYVRLANSRVLAPVDEAPVWSVPCFFVARPFRRRGLTVNLLRAASAEAARRGARAIEGYPVDAGGGRAPDVFVYTGLPGAFEAAGFREVARRSKTRPIYRKVLRAPRAGRATAAALAARASRPRGGARGAATRATARGATRRSSRRG
jgi:GNAT superfamily N-acetyltransferase